MGGSGGQASGCKIASFPQNGPRISMFRGDSSTDASTPWVRKRLGGRKGRWGEERGGEGDREGGGEKEKEEKQ